MTHSPSESDATYQLERLAQELRSDASYMSGILFAYQQQEHISEAALARRLSIEPAQFIRLALCKRPQSQASNFAEQIRQIASFTGANQTILAQIVRQVEAVQTFGSLPPVEKAQVPGQTRASNLSGLLAAARDRSEPEDDVPPENEEGSKKNEQ